MSRNLSHPKYFAALVVNTHGLSRIVYRADNAALETHRDDARIDVVVQLNLWVDVDGAKGVHLFDLDAVEVARHVHRGVFGQQEISLEI